MATRYSLQTTLKKPTLELLNKTAERTGLSKTVIAERLFDWFSQQDELVQLRVLGVLSDELAGRLGQMIIKDMADMPPPAAKGRQAS